MTFVSYFPGRGTLREQAYFEGRAEGAAMAAGAVVRLLDQRLIPLPDDAREHITTCTDLDVLARWLDRAFTVNTVEELFAEDTPPAP
ncbi:hypothetical protein ACOBQB_29175 [Streptomyces sp. G5(2025)]|uniref:hypothetical protein n=1 Tax=Streptomyces sp. G5(2025) TaxID=3406628 RepID=UPI003C23D1F1